MRQLLQNATFITNCNSTIVLSSGTVAEHKPEGYSFE